MRDNYRSRGEEATLGWGGGAGIIILLCGFTCYRIEAIVHGLLGTLVCIKA